MRCFRSALFVLSILLTGASLPAAAADRVLLSTSSAATLASSPSASAALLPLKTAATRDGQVKVIVGLRVPFAPEGTLAPGDRAAQRLDIAAASAALRASYASAIDRSPKSFRAFRKLPFIAMSVSRSELDRLAADPRVLTITENGRASFTLADSVPQINGPEAWAAGYTGNGQTIAILDTGIDKTHPFLAGKVVSEACYSSGGWCPDGSRSSTDVGSGVPCSLNCEHGTHVAGIAAGKLNSGFSGVAQNASLISIMVFSPDATSANGNSASYIDIIAGLNRVYELRNTYSIAAVNLSLGSSGFTSPCDGIYPAMTAAIAQLRSAGIVTVVASGNDGYTNAISFPACISKAVSVGSVSDGASSYCSTTMPTDKVACYSNTSAALSLLAPGSSIRSSVPGGGYATYEGTSMAAPHVAGAWAVLKEKYQNVTPGDVLGALQNSGVPIRDYRVTLTKPRIDVAAALDAFLPITFTTTGTGTGGMVFATADDTSYCTAGCSKSVASGTVITLTPAPAAGSIFAGWSGACTGIRNTCQLTVSAAVSVSVAYSTAPTTTLNYIRQGTGTGTIDFSPTGSVIGCDDTCKRTFTQGNYVTLTPTPDDGSVFSGWSGACQKKHTCIIRMDGARTVSAQFSIAKVSADTQ